MPGAGKRVRIAGKRFSPEEESNSLMFLERTPRLAGVFGA
jgi:hypothetical protein